MWVWVGEAIEFRPGTAVLREWAGGWRGGREGGRGEGGRRERNGRGSKAGEIGTRERDV